MAKQETTQALTVPCCPPLGNDCPCDRLDFQYRQLHHTVVTTNNQRQPVTVEVTIHARFERCPGNFALGDLVYSTTLFPGEKVRLFTQDRRTRFSFDSASKVSYRNEQTHEEHFYMASVSNFMSDLNVRDSARSSNNTRGHFDTHAETSGFLETVFGSPSVDVSGNYNSSSTSTFLRELSQHASASHHRAEMGTRASSAVSVGEVQTRTHAEGQTEDHFESSSREFSNPNRCHAVTFYFYRINKTQTIKFTIEAIERRVIDPAADTKVTNNRFISRGGVSAIPNSVLATDENRLKVEENGRASVAAEARATGVNLDATRLATSQIFVAQSFTVLAPDPIPTAVQNQALKQVDEDLVKAGLLAAVGGAMAPEAQRKFSFERCSSLPTPGLLVKGCLDECSICEPELHRKIELELQHQELQNQLLQKQIALLEKSQEYRCCPANEEEDD
jgi:hypothetical protein